MQAGDAAAAHDGAHSEAGESSASHASHEDGKSAAELVSKLRKKLIVSGDLSLAMHQSAARTMARLRGILASRSERLGATSRFVLLCVGIQVHRRSKRSLQLNSQSPSQCATLGPGEAHAPAGEEELESEDTIAVDALLKRTAACVLVLCAMGEWQSFELEDEEQEHAAARATMEARETVTLELPMLPPPSRKRSGMSDEQREEAERRVTAWQRAISEQPRPERVARAALRAAALVVAAPAAPEHYSYTDTEQDALFVPAWTRLETIAPIYFRASSDALASRMLLPDGDTDFVSLAAARLARDSEEERLKKLRAIAQGAESEAGQGVARALMLSFLLPMAVVGTRRTLLLSREANTRAMLDFPQAVERAHNVACVSHSFERPRGNPVASLQSCAPCTGWPAPSGSLTRARTT